MSDSSNQEEVSSETKESQVGVNIEVSAFRKTLKNRGFMALWIGQSISCIGDWVIVGLLLDMVNRLGKGNPAALAIMLTFRLLPAFLFGLAAGAVVDRLDRKTVMITCEIARGTLVTALAFSNSLAL
ncbi:MAG: MFS transporter, partial [Actinomycetota bacterium]|nr:MFS transporter [Actinomycetota bacterium]